MNWLLLIPLGIVAYALLYLLGRWLETVMLRALLRFCSYLTVLSGREETNRAVLVVHLLEERFKLVQRGLTLGETLALLFCVGRKAPYNGKR